MSYLTPMNALNMDELILFKTLSHSREKHWDKVLLSKLFHAQLFRSPFSYEGLKS